MSFVTSMLNHLMNVENFLLLSELIMEHTGVVFSLHISLTHTTFVLMIAIFSAHIFVPSIEDQI